MGLRIQHNIAAMNAHRQLSISDSGLSKSLERLSSGYRINKAADDAAGLAISSGFRADIASFKVASRNTAEANSMLQVAEGGMDQVGNMLTRLKELATQAASANVGSTERSKINSEATALRSEIDRIASSTQYGSTSLLDGTFGASQSGVLGAGTAGDGIVDDANDNIVYDFTFTGAGAAQVTALGSGVVEGTFTITQTAAGGFKIVNSGGTISETFTGSVAGTSVSFSNLGITIAVTAGTIDSVFSVGSSSTVKFERTGLTSLNVTAAAPGTYNITQTAVGVIKIENADATASQILTFQSHTDELDFDVLGIKFTLETDFSNTTTELSGMQMTVSANTAATGNTFQVGSKNDSNNQIDISISGISTTNLSIDAIDLSTATGAQSALTSIDSAVSTLAGSRGDIGAYMNRLNYAAANLASTIENTQAAESIIRDVDMAAEMTNFTKNQILMQAGTAMLAQANMAPQNVLSLFG